MKLGFPTTNKVEARENRGREPASQQLGGGKVGTTTAQKKRRKPSDKLLGLLAVWPPSEITGVTLSTRDMRVVRGLATRISKRINEDGKSCRAVPSIHMREVLRAMQNDASLPPTGAVHIASLLADLEQPNGRFRCGNLAYQAVVEVPRSWEKRQHHAHIGRSVHPGFAWNGMVNISRRVKRWERLVCKGLPVGFRLLWELVRESKGKPELWHQLSCEHARTAVCSLFASRFLKPKDVVVNAELFKCQVAHVALQHFADNVTDLCLLIKIIDKEFEKEDPLKVLRAAIEGCKEAERLANSEWRRGCSGGKLFSVRLGLSFPRMDSKKDREHYPDYVRDVVGRVVRERKKRQRQEWAERVVAVDISGPEALMDHRMNTRYWKTSDFKEALREAARNGMTIAAHLGDWGNTYGRWGENAKGDRPQRLRRKALAELADRESMVRQLLKFTRDGIETLEEIKSQECVDAAVNHGIALAPEGALITKGPRREMPGKPHRFSFAGQSVANHKNLEEIRRQLEIVREHGIEMRCCPTVNVRSQEVHAYRGHPVFAWIDPQSRNDSTRAIKASLNVDDSYWFDSGTTLSDDIAKMMLAGPDWFTVAMARECCSHGAR